MQHQVRSRPVYQDVVNISCQAKHHLFVAQDKMSDALSQLYAQCDSGERMLITVQAPQTPEDALSLTMVGTLPLSTAVYASGDENFLWRVATALTDGGMLAEQVHLLPPTAKTRKVYCCHCSAFTSGVLHSPATCSGCGRLLAVSDHFSRRFGAYRGYQVNAEDPNDIPEPEELN